jgi:hypothetical protein
MNQNKIRNELLELGGSIEGIQRKIQELLKAFDVPESNPRKRVNHKQQRVTHYLNMIDARITKKRGQYND